MGSPKVHDALVALGLGLSACSAQMNAQLQTSSSGSDDRRWEVPETSGQGAAATPVASAVVKPGAGAMGTGLRALGVVHDLSIKPEAVKAASCTCLSVAWGPPGDPRFAWQAGLPNVSSDVIAVAISGDLECGWNARLAKPSIAGVEREGDDIVVTVEGADGGRPIVRGALLVRPAQSSAIVVRGRGKVPYGTPVGASRGVCRIPMQ